MKICEQSTEICTETGLKKIETIGKICTKREYTIKDDTAIPFVTNRIQEGHNAILMHEYVYFDLSNVQMDVRRDLLLYNPHIEYTNYGQFIAINYRTLLDMLLDTKVNKRRSSLIKHEEALSDLVYLMWLYTPEFRDLFYSEREIFDFINPGVLSPLSEYIKRVEPAFILLNYPELFVATVKLTTDRGVSHEVVRHTEFAYMQESTRWCNYSKDNQGGQIQFIQPFEEDETEAARNWHDFMATVEAEYMEFINKFHWTAQIARSVLTNSLKTDIYITGTLDKFKGELINQQVGKLHIKEAKGFLPQRKANSAHPQMRELAIKLENALIAVYPEFNNIK